MQIGKAGPAITSICEAHADRIEVRGRDLTRDLMGRVGFTDYFHLLLTGREPTENQRFFLDLLLVAIAEHGLVPTVQAARMTLAADPGSLQGALAAGILGAGPVILGTSELCGRLLVELREKGDSRTAVKETLAEIRASGARLPGLATRSTSRSTRAPSASSPWPPSEASPASMCGWRSMSEPPPPRSGASRWS